MNLHKTIDIEFKSAIIMKIKTLKG